MSVPALVLDRHDRYYVELPAALTRRYAETLALPPHRPLLLWCGDVEQYDDDALDGLAIRLAGRRVGFLRLGPDLTAHLLPRVARLAHGGHQ